ncbi:hypothetical protein EA187_15440 [Lujinxingia sediminis]|uniref:Beta-lactamase n=1 Tax=Lujinxingia sediminis TaxID=2480984 RepID=A0ABY0CQY7_9DELT|nr:hypothetical protein [Lujinxingia sediminis]RVU42580.1 hypothetical protein EA187_15440 [Lujinxingia sediminis]
MFGSLKTSGWIGFLAGFLVASLVAGGLYGALGDRGKQEDVEQAFDRVGVAYEPDEEPVEVAGEASDEGTLEECRATLATVRASHEEALQTFKEHEELTEYLGGLIEEMSPDRPIAFPEELDVAYQPETFKASVEALKRECPDVFGERANADCSEYPCMVELPFKKEGEENEPQRLDLKALCPALATYFPSSMTQQFSTQVGDEAWVQYMPQGTGIGLEERLAGQEMRLMQRARKRWNEKRRRLSHEVYEDACVREQDAEACKHLAGAYGIEDAERDVYLQMGCDNGDSGACYAYSNDRCQGRGRCDAEAEYFARRALELTPESEYRHENLGIVLCGRGAEDEARRSFEQACALGLERACGRRC